MTVRKTVQKIESAKGQLPAIAARELAAIRTTVAASKAGTRYTSPSRRPAAAAAITAICPITGPKAIVRGVRVADISRCETMVKQKTLSCHTTHTTFAADGKPADDPPGRYSGTISAPRLPRARAAKDRVR